MNRGAIVTILAIIGGIVVLGWLLKISFKLLGVLIGVGLVVLVLAFVSKLRGGPR